MRNGDAPSHVARWVKSLRGSLSLRLFLWLFGVIIVAFAVYAAVSIQTARQQWNHTVSEGAQRFTDLIQRSTHYSMLLNHKEEVYHTIQTIAQAHGVEGVRIYDKDGTIMFSGDEHEIGQSVDLRAEACVICHEQQVPLRSVPSASRTRVYGSRSEGRVLGLISPIFNSAECSSAPCHAHPASQTVLGVLDVKMSMREADAGLARVTRDAITAAVLTALVVGIFSAWFIWHAVRRPVGWLIDGASRVAGGDLDTEIRAGGREDEIGQLAREFNRMTQDLKRARDELTQWSKRLESKLMDKTAELTRTQRQVVHMEKMASLGKLAATVAHELNNPLAGVLNYAKLVERTLRDGSVPANEREELTSYLQLIQKEAGRCGSIVRNLLLFARHSGAEMALASINEVIDRALMLVRHHLEMSNTKVSTGLLEGDDQVVCDANQIQQALVALFVNAVEAMPEGGTLSVKAEEAGDDVRLVVADTGVGVPSEVLPRIFEPFFSTKGDQSVGAGLGLAVVYGIVQRHGGEIHVESEPEHGTTFTITLPRRHTSRTATAEGMVRRGGRPEAARPDAQQTGQGADRPTPVETP